MKPESDFFAVFYFHLKFGFDIVSNKHIDRTLTVSWENKKLRNIKCNLTSSCPWEKHTSPVLLITLQLAILNSGHKNSTYLLNIHILILHIWYLLTRQWSCQHFRILEYRVLFWSAIYSGQILSTQLRSYG